jgi:hypothetical protein
MPLSLATVNAIQFLWKESKPVRSWIWGKLPMVRDTKKRDIVEGLLAKLLDDANKIAQVVPPDEVDSKLEERLAQFRKEIEAEGIKDADADAFMERATLLARLMVTGPLGNVIDLRGRLAILEADLETAEKALAAHTAQNEKMSAQLESLHRRLATMQTLAIVGATAGVLSLVVALAALVSHK